MAAVKKLQQELKSFTKDPLDGVMVTVDDTDLFTWNVGFFGPPDSIYTGGYFKAVLKFPPSYPFEPPAMQMTTPLFHPNIYADGKICISILHPPGEDEMSGERPEERWNPTQTVRTIILSVLSILNEPNISSPANVDASVAFRDWQAGKSKQYELRVRDQVKQSQQQAADEGLSIPMTQEEYLASKAVSASAVDTCVDEGPEDEDYYDESDMDSDVCYSEEDDEDEDEDEEMDEDDE